MSEVIKGNFESEGLSIGDKRAIALHEWMNSREFATVEEIKAEMARLKRIMPSPEDDPPAAWVAAKREIDEGWK